MDYNHIFLENKQYTNKTMLSWLNMMAGVVVFLWALSLLHIISVSSISFYYAAPICAAFLLAPTVCNYFFHLSTNTLAPRKNLHLLSKLIILCSILAVFSLSVSLSYYATFAWFFPMVIACQYYSKKITRYSFILCLIGFLFSYFISLYVGVWDNNFIYHASTSTGIRDVSLTVVAESCLYLLPRFVLFCASFPLFYAITSRTELLLKKQNLSMIANEAKRTFHELQDIPDTFVTDCKIKMRYLAKNNIDVDTALVGMEDNVEKYNEFVLTFIGESHRKEDELYSLLAPDTLLQYGAKVHALRIKANALGLNRLTDTAFFHEMEAYAGNIEIVESNWEKLSFEWDEACELFTHYITSIGIKEHASDGNGHQISFQEWSEQLKEAFHALELYDTAKARTILTNLANYQLDTDLHQKIELMIANIDDILKA